MWMVIVWFFGNNIFWNNIWSLWKTRTFQIIIAHPCTTRSMPLRRSIESYDTALFPHSKHVSSSFITRYTVPIEMSQRQGRERRRRICKPATSSFRGFVGRHQASLPKVRMLPSQMECIEPSSNLTQEPFRPHKSPIQITTRQSIQKNLTGVDPSSQDCFPLSNSLNECMGEVESVSHLFDG